MTTGIAWAILNGRNRIIDDHGSGQIFPSRKRAEQHLSQPHIRAYFDQQNRQPVRVEKVKISGTITNRHVEILRDIPG
jgi:hypothetical protein